jgi:hypothetical protein
VTFTLLIVEVRTYLVSSVLSLKTVAIGKSDPFAVFSLNGSRVFKSQTKKKTLNPIWNETFVVPVVSFLAYPIISYHLF